MRHATLLTVVVAALSSACDTTSYGDLQVNYRIGSGTITCNDAGIVALRVTLINAERDPIEETAPCTDSASLRYVLIREVPADVYRVVIDGLGAGDALVYRGEAEGQHVVADRTNQTDTVRLTPLPASMRVQWDFPVGMCGSNNVDFLHVVVYHRSGSISFEDDQVPCESEQVEVTEGLVADSYDLRVRAIDQTSGEYTFYYDEDGIQLEDGRMTTIMATLQVCPAPACEDP